MVDSSATLNDRQNSNSHDKVTKTRPIIKNLAGRNVDIEF